MNLKLNRHVLGEGDVLFGGWGAHNRVRNEYTGSSHVSFVYVHRRGLSEAMVRGGGFVE